MPVRKCKRKQLKVLKEKTEQCCDVSQTWSSEHRLSKQITGLRYDRNNWSAWEV
jgi:hypothetical protein